MFVPSAVVRASLCIIGRVTGFHLLPTPTSRASRRPLIMRQLMTITCCCMIIVCILVSLFGARGSARQQLHPHPQHQQQPARTSILAAMPSAEKRKLAGHAEQAAESVAAVANAAPAELQKMVKRQQVPPAPPAPASAVPSADAWLDGQYRIVLGAQGYQDFAHLDRGIARVIRSLTLRMLDDRSLRVHISSVDFQHNLPRPNRFGDEIMQRAPITMYSSLPFYDPGSSTSSTFNTVYVILSPFWSTDTLNNVLPERFQRDPRVKVVALVYDLIPLHEQGRYFGSDHAERDNYLRRVEMLAACDALIAISNATKQDIVQSLNYPAERVFVAHNGFEEHFAAPSSPPGDIAKELDESGAVKGLRPGFIMYTGGGDPRKNERRLIEAYARLPARLRARHQLVLVGKKSDAEVKALRQYVATVANAAAPSNDDDDDDDGGGGGGGDNGEGGSGDIIITGLVSERTLLKLYQSCALFAYPSMVEGFGLPIVEAIRSGALVVASDRSSPRELVPIPELRFDPSTAESIRDTMQAVLELTERDPARARDMRRRLHEFVEQNFSWAGAVRAVEKALRAAAIMPRRVPLRPGEHKSAFGGHYLRWTKFREHAAYDLRLAVFTPYPPSSRSGIARYTQQLLHSLSDLYDSKYGSAGPEYVGNSLIVDVFVDRDWRDDTGRDVQPGMPRMLRRHLRIRHHADFADAHLQRPYHDVLYCVGNSESHVYMLPYLRRFPGRVMLHDVRLTGLYLMRSMRDHPAEYDARGRNTAFRDTLLDTEGHAFRHADVPAEVLGKDGRTLHRDWFVANRLFMTRDVLRQATQVIVFSEYARRICLRILGAPDHGDAGKVAVMPFAHESVAGERAARRRARVAEALQESHEVLISTFGLVDFESKKVDKVIGAVARVQKRLQARGSPVKLHLAVVGETHGEHVVDIMREIADKHGYNRSALLHVTGRVDAGQYADWLERTAVAVQLRVKTNGERSAALADCLAMGIPTIVNPIGAVATDIPSDAVLPLDVSAAMERTSPAATEDVDPEALAALLERVLFDHALLRRVSERAEAFAKVHSFDHLAQQYLRLFRR